jgi:hypothetical protein
MIYTADDSKEYLITSTGANDLAKNWIEDKLFISFIDMSNNNGQ